MKTKNKIGPNTESCGTPDVTITLEDLFSMTSVCDLFDRNGLIQGEPANELQSDEAKEATFLCPRYS